MKSDTSRKTGVPKMLTHAESTTSRIGKQQFQVMDIIHFDDRNKRLEVIILLVFSSRTFNSTY